MKKVGNILWGLVFIVLGLIFGLNALGITDINIFFRGWWTLIIIIPSLIGVIKDSTKFSNYIWLLLGIVLFLTAQGILDINKVGKLIFPAILVCIGIAIIFKDTISTKTNDKIKELNKDDKEEYYAEAIFSLYDWQKIGIEEFTVAERNNLIQRIQNEYCVELYQKLEAQGIDSQDIPIVLLNMVTRRKDFEITENDTSETIKAKRLEQYDRMIAENRENLNQRSNTSVLNQDLSIERIERFLGYYDVQGTGIQLRPYQQRATDRADEILQENRFASVILPTGGGKSFVALSQLMEHQNEEMLYLAPQNEILEQMKDYVIKYIHGPVNTIRKKQR